MAYFTLDYIKFFQELEKNNNKEWFYSQKKRYEQRVKNAFLNFLEDFIAAIQKKDATIQVTPKDCILRINRDIRFSKDKSPYNLHFTAFVSPTGRKDKSIPGIFLRFSPKMVGIMGGCFGPDKIQLHKIRTAINNDPKAFRKLLGNKTFKDKFGELQGDKMKRIPKEWQAAAVREPLILHKQFYFMAEREAELILKDNLLSTLMTYWTAARPVNDYLLNCLQD